MKDSDVDPNMVFPTGRSIEGMGSISEGGLTKRELFAAMAMQGLLANREWADCSIHRTPDMKPAEVVIIEIATEAADFLIAELAKEPK